MNYSAINIRGFIGAKNFEESKEFYTKLGFEIVDIPGKMVLVKVNDKQINNKSGSNPVIPTKWTSDTTNKK